MFNHANFTKADLTAVALENCKLDGAFFYQTKMEDVNLGLYPEIKTLSKCKCCKFSPNSEEIVAGSEDGSIFVWDIKNNKIKLTIQKRS